MHKKFLSDKQSRRLLSKLFYSKAEFGKTSIGLVAINCNTPAAILELLSFHPENYVNEFYTRDLYCEFPIRGAVALNPNISCDILIKLSIDSNSLVRAAVAFNPVTPTTILKKLSEDKNSKVCASVARNPHTPVAVLRKLSSYKHPEITMPKYFNRNGIYDPRSIAFGLSDDYGERNSISGFVASNPNAPKT